MFVWTSCGCFKFYVLKISWSSLPNSYLTLTQPPYPQQGRCCPSPSPPSTHLALIRSGNTTIRDRRRINTRSNPPSYHLNRLVLSRCDRSRDSRTFSCRWTLRKLGIFSVNCSRHLNNYLYITFKYIILLSMYYYLFNSVFFKPSLLFLFRY